MVLRHSRRRNAPCNPSAAASPQAGFSLPEMLIVVAIIMLLSVLSFPSLRKARHSAQQASAAQTMNTIKTGQMTHHIINGEYAPSFKVLRQEMGNNLPGAGPGSDTGTGGGGEDVMVWEGYIYRMNRTSPDDYTVTAEPIEDRDSRPSFSMDQNSDLQVSNKPPQTSVGATKKPPEPPPPPPGGTP